MGMNNVRSHNTYARYTEVKELKKDAKGLTKKVEAQLEQKLDHELDQHDELSMQKMYNKYDPARNMSVALSLEDKKALESHKVKCKRRTKDDEKDTKVRDIQSNLGFAANMLQNTTYINGGMWQTGSDADVSCLLLFLSCF
jgi:hypothetical protein